MDIDGHGTHVAGTIASKAYGVAKKSTVIAVKVVEDDGFATIFSVTKGLEYAIQRKRKFRKPMIVNLSLTALVDEDLDKAVDDVICEGIYVVVAAGNFNHDACRNSPGRVRNAITVAAVDYNDKRPYFSSFGGCVDVFAPGVGVVSTFRPPFLKMEAFGTSMAAAHATGVFAVLMSQKPKLYECVQSGTADFLSIATRGKVVDARSANNLISYLNLENVVMGLGGVNGSVEAVGEMRMEESNAEKGSVQATLVILGFGLVGLLAIGLTVFSVKRLRMDKREESEDLVGNTKPLDP